MGIETVLFKSEEKQSAGDIANTLRHIADKIDSGNITLQRGSDQVSIDFPPNMVLELKVEEEQGRRLKKSLEIELEWIVDGEQSGTGDTVIT
ncbi:MAG: amphi-Trp domain-containing protein [Desulfurivibrionaceae bacterium]